MHGIGAPAAISAAAECRRIDVKISAHREADMQMMLARRYLSAK